MSPSQAFGPNATPGAPRRFTATVVRLDRHADDVTGVFLAPAADAAFDYRPGQYLSVLLDDGARRSFSMASRRQPGGPIELHIRRRPGGRFSEDVLAKLAVGDALRIEGPFGQVDWRGGPGPVVLMGTGTGLAPLKALIEHGLAQAPGRPIHLYWGGRSPQDLYLAPLLHSWAADHAAFAFTPVLSRPHADWSGRRGYVQDAVAEDFASLDGAHVYACGSPGMIDGARERLGAHPGFDEDRFLTDAFEPADAAPSPPQPASTLLAALRAAGAPILSVCGGRASCGACKVAIDAPWRERLPPPGRTERRLLANLDDAGPHDRLACQILLTREIAGLAVSLASRTTALWPA